MLAAAILGGTLAAGSHLAKSGSRAVINTSPEPFSNWAASFGEELAVGTVLWLAFAHPLVALIVLALLVALMIWIIPKVWRMIRAIVNRIVDGLPVRSTIGAMSGAARHLPHAYRVSLPAGEAHTVDGRSSRPRCPKRDVDRHEPDEPVDASASRARITRSPHTQARRCSPSSSRRRPCSR